MAEHTYFFNGVILPERAQISINFPISFYLTTNQTEHHAFVSIVLNQVAVWVDTSVEWNTFDLKNAIKSIIQDHLSIIGFLWGYAYDLEITRVTSRDLQVDWVFGIDIPYLSKRYEGVDTQQLATDIHKKCSGMEGAYVRRCFNDLSQAMKHPEDTGFYCYRALESLRHHYAQLQGITAASKSIQWDKFREFCAVNRDSLMLIKNAADPVRHGEPTHISGEDREKLLTTTWEIVDSYFQISKTANSTPSLTETKEISVRLDNPSK